VVGHILNGHVTGKIQDTTLKLSDVASVRIGKADFDLADHLAGAALDPVNRQPYYNPFEGPARSQESSPGGTPFRNTPASATGTAQRTRVLFNGEDDLFTNILGAPISVAHYIERVVQQAGGHALASFQDFHKPRKDQACPLSVFNYTYANTG
jgi:hypothetical protein